MTEEKWQDSLPDELKTDATLRNFETPEDAYKAVIDLKRKQGNMIRLSSEDASEEERAANREKIMKAHPDLMRRPDFTDEAATKEYLAFQGVPDEPTGYEVGETELPTEWIDTLREDALREELTPRQFNARIDNLNRMFSEQQQQASDDLAAHKQELANNWGAALESRMRQVDWVKKEFFSEFGELGEMNNTAIQGLYKIAQALQGKGPQAHTQPHEPANAITPEEAMHRANELREKIKENRNPSERDALIKKMVEMQKLSNPARYA